MENSNRFLTLMALRDEVDINVSNVFGETALHYACFLVSMHQKRREAIWCAHQLIHAGADVNVIPTSDWTVFDYAINHNAPSLALILLSVGADPRKPRTNDTST